MPDFSFDEQPIKKLSDYSLDKKQEEDSFRNKEVKFLRQVADNPRAREIARDDGIYVSDNPGWITFLQVFFWIAIFIVIGLLLYFIGTGKFQSVISNNISNSCPEIIIPRCPDCSNECKPVNTCPSMNCSFPSTLNIYLKNST